MTLMLSKKDGIKLDRFVELDLMPTPDPTPTWCPLSHFDFVLEARRRIQTSGWQIKKEEHGVSHDRQRYFGLLWLERDNSIAGVWDKPKAIYQTLCGLRNSNDQKFAAGMSWGAEIIVCSNLMFTGEVKLNRKHTRFIKRDLPKLIDRTVAQLHAMQCKQQRYWSAYNGVGLGPVEAHDLLIQALDYGIFAPSDLPKILTNWREMPEFNARTLWRFVNAITKQLTPKLQTGTLQDRTILLQDKLLRPLIQDQLTTGV